jgi:hypothetical protein
MNKLKRNRRANEKSALRKSGTADKNEERREKKVEERGG